MSRSPPRPAKPGRASDGEPLIAGAVEVRGRGPGRARLAVIGNYSAATLGAFGAAAAGGSTVVSDGWPGHGKLKDVRHDPGVIGPMAAHVVVPPWIHRVFASARRRALGVYHGLRREHLRAYLDEFVFRFNRRHTPAAAFGRLLGLAVTLQPATYQMLIGRS